MLISFTVIRRREMKRRRGVFECGTLGLGLEGARRVYRKVVLARDLAAMRRLCLGDLYFLLTVALGRGDADNGWAFERCREFQAAPDGRLDCWAREHYKSTIITFAGTVQEILRNPEVTVGMFSITRPNAKKPLKQIKQEFEENTLLKRLFPDVLYAEPKKESPKWSEDDGICVRRQGNPKEQTVAASGLIDGLPTGAHFDLRVYDDAIDQDSVTSPEMMRKVVERWELSLSLGKRGGRARYIGTRYHANDLYATMMKRRSVTPRIYPATDDGTAQGRPVFLTPEEWEQKKRDNGPYTLACQYLQNPKEDGAMGFKEEWLRFYPNGTHPARSAMNVYMVVDGAKGLKSTNDYTVMWVFGLAPDRNRYILDGYRGRLNLGGRTERLFSMVEKWRPKAVGYEKDSAEADLDRIEEEMKNRRWRFNIVPIPTHGVSKSARILRLQPDFQNGTIWMPDRLLYVDHAGETRDMVADFRSDEYLMFPVCTHDDMIDDLANMYAPELGAVWPLAPDAEKAPTQTNSAWDPFK